MTTYWVWPLHTILIVLEMTLMLVTWATMHMWADGLILLHGAVTVVHALIILSDALRGIIHFNGASIKLFSVHFLESSLGLLFWEKFNESIAFRLAAHRVNDHLRFADRVVYLLEELQQIVVCNIWIEITHVHLVCLWLTALCRTSAARVHSYRRRGLRHLALIILPHIIVIVVGLLVWHWAIVICAGDAATMWRPVQLEIPVVVPWDLLAIERGEHVSGNLVILKLDEAVADGLVGLFVLDQFYIDYIGNTMELHRNILLGHVGQYIAYPEGLSLLLLCLLLWHGRTTHIWLILTILLVFLVGVHVGLLHFIWKKFNERERGIELNWWEQRTKSK